MSENQDTNSISTLLNYINNLHLEAGIIQDDNIANKITLSLQTCWDDFEGSNDTSMTLFKIHRIEKLAWNPPFILEFDIERHGATVMNSIYAHVYHWEVDLKKEIAKWRYPKKRLVGQRDKPLNVIPIAENIAQEIENQNMKSENHEWKSDKKVRVLISNIIPETDKQTTATRRKRFRTHLENLLLPKGWHTTTVFNVYEKKPRCLYD